MRKLLSVICIVLLSVGMIFAQSTVVKKKPSSTGSTGTTTTTTSTTKSSSSDSNSNNGTDGGSSATKGNPSTPSTSTSSSSTTGSTTTYSYEANDSVTTSTAKSDVTLDHFIIGGGLSAGGVLATNLIGSGLILNAEFEVMVQFKHHRFGIGGDKTLMLTPENLGTVLVTLGKSNRNLNKVYMIYEWTLFKRSPINFTAGLKLGSFDVGASDYKTESKSTERAPFFGSVGIALEVGHPRFLLYIKPEIGIHSYEKVWRYDLFAMATIGFRWKSKRLDKYESLNTTTTGTSKKYE